MIAKNFCRAPFHSPAPVGRLLQQSGPTNSRLGDLATFPFVHGRADGNQRHAGRETELWQSRRIVFIGRNLDAQPLQKGLETCIAE